jgi:hypothetical protein
MKQRYNKNIALLVFIHKEKIKLFSWGGTLLTKTLSFQGWGHIMHQLKVKLVEMNKNEESFLYQKTTNSLPFLSQTTNFIWRLKFLELF